MTREVRANVIFLVCLAALSTPGFIILIRRTLTGATRPAVVPDQMATMNAYMQPPPAPPGLPRYEPPLVRDWVRQLLQARLGPGVKVMRSPTSVDLPPVSDKFVTQLAGLRVADDGSVDLALIRWDDSRPISMTDPIVTATLAGQPVKAKTLCAEPIDVPKDVRHALQNLGYVDPPGRVWWLACALPAQAGTPPPTAIALDFIDAASAAPLHETINLAPATSAATRP